MNEIIIRDATVQERDAIRDATLAAYQEYAAVLPDWAWNVYSEDVLKTVTHPDPAEQIVAERGGEIIGAVLLYPRGGTYQLPDGSRQARKFPEVRVLAVTPAARTHGIGKTLMQECLARAQRAGAAELHLHTLAFMQAAIRLYGGMGFQRAPDLDISPVPEFLIMGYRYVFDSAAP